MKARRVLKWGAIIGAVAFVAAQFVQPPRTNPAVDPARTMAAHVQVTQAAAAILDRACLDCHSFRTDWPWYSHVAPVSWFVRDHVNHGRQHLNFDDWLQANRRGNPATSAGLLDAICKEVEAGEMPLESYTWIHRRAVLTGADAATLCQWTRAERARLAAGER